MTSKRADSLNQAMSPLALVSWSQRLGLFLTDLFSNQKDGLCLINGCAASLCCQQHLVAFALRLDPAACIPEAAGEEKPS